MSIRIQVSLDATFCDEMVCVVLCRFVSFCDEAYGTTSGKPNFIMTLWEKLVAYGPFIAFLYIKKWSKGKFILLRRLRVVYILKWPGQKLNPLFNCKNRKWNSIKHLYKTYENFSCLFCKKISWICFAVAKKHPICVASQWYLILKLFLCEGFCRHIKLQANVLKDFHC